MGSGPTRLLALPLAITTVAITLGACSDDGGEEEPEEVEATGPSADALEVVEIEELDLPIGDAYLSPNGERIATYANRELCVFTADGEPERCAEGKLDLDPNSVRWNPDGSRLLFTENFHWGDEPDIWSFDAESGELADLTDDGVDPDDFSVFDETEDADIDTSPEWVDDGSTIRFVRWVREDDAVEVMEMPAAGGDPEDVGTLATESAPGVIAYTADGERAVYANKQKLVVSDLDGENVEIITDTLTYSLSAPSGAGPILARWVTSDPSVPPALVVSADGVSTGLHDVVTWAASRIDGEGMLYAAVENGDPRRLRLRIASAPDQQAREIARGPYGLPYRTASALSPIWSTQDTILLLEQPENAAGEFQYVLVHLGAE